MCSCLIDFRVEPGRSEYSYGIRCALESGMQDDVIKRAEEILSKKKVGKSTKPLRNESFEKTLNSYRKITVELTTLNCDDPQAVKRFMTLLRSELNLDKQNG